MNFIVNKVYVHLSAAKLAKGLLTDKSTLLNDVKPYFFVCVKTFAQLS